LRIIIISSKKIKKGEELFYDYGQSFKMEWFIFISSLNLFFYFFEFLKDIIGKKRTKNKKFKNINNKLKSNTQKIWINKI